MKGMKLIFAVLLITLLIPILWNSVPSVKKSIHSLLDPSAGRLLDWNIDFGMIILVAILTFATSIVQKYGTDQEALRQLKAEQKILNEEMKKYKNDPGKLLELQKKSFEFIPKTFDLTLKPTLFTLVPLILLFRWFADYFSVHTVKIFGIFGWIWGYLIMAIVFSMIYRKILKLA